MNMGLIEKQLEILSDIVYNVQCAEGRLRRTKSPNTLGIYRFLYSDDKRNRDIEIKEKALIRWKLRYLEEVDTLDDLNYGIKVDTARERF